jgi:hypothetical protein
LEVLVTFRDDIIGEVVTMIRKLMPVGISRESGGRFLYEFGGSTSGIIRRVVIGGVWSITLSGITDRCRWNNTRRRGRRDILSGKGPRS